MISSKFTNIKVEDDTKILSREEMKLGDYDVMHEIWVWEGIQAESLIFFNEDISDLNEEEILKLVGKEHATYQKAEEYTFVNYNFTTPY